MERLSIIGLGNVGLPMAAFFASRGFRVIGLDLNPEIIELIKRRNCHIYEPGVSELLSVCKGSLVATNDYKFAIENSEASFIVVPTPSDEDGAFSTRFVIGAGEEIAQNLKGKTDFHLIVLTSTVLPGATTHLKEVLEKGSGKRCGIDFGLCYSPQFIALGSVLQGLSNPDLILIGESESKSGEMLSKTYKRACENNPSIVRTSFHNAELGKILLNSYITMKISFANFLAEMCERIPGADADKVSQILGLDSRVGRKFLTGGLGFGGPCFPRDNRAISYFARTIGVDAELPKAAHEVNLHQNKRIVELLKQKLGELKNKRIAVLGLTYKPNTDVVEESASLEIIKALVKEGAIVSAYDPAGATGAESILGKSITYIGSIEGCLKDAEFCILATPWEEFRKLKPGDFLRNMKRPVILDCWRILDSEDFRKNLEYLGIGLSGER